ncbi:telomerase-binding protein EST1A-like isoform X2 [Phymastichus coffea]|uniref:telomerase-binding protein EST1A-like isoform X2 n=1 Tax=Phymastichus coffea TaxID=108790 RepID=UPI00273A991C|nr:telomerase-binding protein EST1A-like isoform X2 [Phymastichus coffea]
MANHDKGRRKWGEISQENSINLKFEKERLAAMRGGGNKAPPRALYRPGSGPLRKSGRSDDFDHENNSQERPKMPSVQDRLKQSHFSNPSQSKISSRLQVDSLSDRLNDTHINTKNHVDGNNGQSTSKNHHSSINDPRKKNKKPEQPLYVPKKVKEAMAEHETINKPSLENHWDRERSSSRADRDWDVQSNRNRNDTHPSRNMPSNFGNQNDGRVKDEHSKRGNRRNRNVSDNEDRRRTESPASTRNFGNRNRDNPREIRQGSEPLFITAKNLNDTDRIRDTRSVEPLGYSDKFQGKPPSGKRGGKEITMPKRLNPENLPPRLRAKYHQEHGITQQNSSIGTSEGAWDGNSLTFQVSHGSTPRYPVMPHSQTMQNLPPSGSAPPQSNWSNTVPARSRGRGRPRPEESQSPPVFRPVTPDEYTAPSSRSHTPSQEYANRSHDRRGSNSTMCTSMESLSRVDSLLMPPPASSPGSYRSQVTRCQSPVNSRRRESIPSLNSHRPSHQTHKINNNISETNSMQEKPKSQQKSNVSPTKSEPCSPVPDDKSEVLDWYEEVELSERLEAEQMSRSSSIMSLRDNANAPAIQPPTGGRSGKSRSSKKKKSRRGRDKSKDKIEESSRERQNNQQNRENDNYNNNQKNSSSSSSNKRFEGRRRNSHRSRDRQCSKDRNFRGGRGADDFYRNRTTSQNIEENWRAGRTSICESDDGRRTPLSHSTPVTSSGPSSTHRHSPSTHTNSQQPGVLVLPDQTHLSSNAPPPRQQLSQQQKRILFDPNNPNKPIIVNSPGSRASGQQRDNDLPVQPASTPVYHPHTNMQPIIHHGFQSTLVDNMSMSHISDQFGSMRPVWYDPCSESFRSSKNPYLLLDIGRADSELQYILSSTDITSSWDQICHIRNFHQESLKTLLVTDLKFCESENIEQHFWKIVFYNIIEILRKPLAKEDTERREQHKKLLLKLVDEGTTYFTSLLTVLETTYQFKHDTYLTSTKPPKGLGMIGLALISAQKLFLFLGDLARYKELATESANNGKSRQWYLKAQQINPKNGRPYSKLALLATYARRKLDAVYYYMRSLMASNPFPSARESLITMFDENRKKYESTERKRKEERELKERARMKEKEGANLIGGSLRREIWIHPDGKRMRRTTSATTSTDSRMDNSDLEDLTMLTSVELNKRFITSYLHVHGKLITRIGMETFQEAAIQMLREFRTLLHHTPLPLPGTRLLQLLALNMFAIETTQLKDSQMEQGYRSEVQERALVVSLQMFNLILERGVSLLKAQLDNAERPWLIVVEDMQILLPAIKIWCDWMLCHSTVWNPPPSCADYRVGPPGDAWSRLATMVNLLDKLEYSQDLLIDSKDAAAREDELKLVRLPEDTTLSGFTPLMSNPQDPFYADKKEDIEVVQVCLRIYKILFFGQVFLCGLETPVLKLQKSETGVSEYVSVVEASGPGSPSSPPEQSDSELMVESYSEDEEEAESSLTSPRLSLGDTGYDSVTSSTTAAAAAGGEIRLLIERKEELEKRQRKQDRHRQRVQAILQKSSLSVEIEVRPKHLVPDTNCFIDYLAQLQSIAKATAGAQPIYTLMVPLVVLNELEGLSKGANPRDCGPMSKAVLNPGHVARVAENAKAGLAFARSRNPAIRCLTTKGTVLASSSFTVEEDETEEALTGNDDRILATCLSLCKSNKDQVSEEGQPRRVKRDVVLLTEDRNLRVKALARDMPVREVPDFIQWAGLS